MRAIRFIFSRLFICIVVIAALVAAIIFLCLYIHSLLPAAAAVALASTLSCVAAGMIMRSDLPADFKCAFLSAVVFLPVAGAALYFLYALSRGNALPSAPPPPPASCNELQYFEDGADYLKKLEELIYGAQSSVLLEYYIIAKGRVWQGIYAALQHALKRNVEVKIIYDGVGSALKAPVKDLRTLQRSGAEVRVFNKPLPAPLTRLNHRDHRKIAVIDGACVFLGGVNVADEYAHLTSPHGYWKDGGALFYGDIAGIYAAVFRGKPGSSRSNTPPSRITANRPGGDKLLLPVTDRPEARGSTCEDLLTSAIYSARTRVFIFTPYLCAGDKLSDALASAAGRGVEVKIIIPGTPDKKFTYAITRAYCRELTSRGVQVFCYSPGFMHFKGVVCDGRALLGSYNFDYRSLRLNYECGVWGGGELCARMAEDFNRCLESCKPFNAKRRGLPIAVARVFAPLV